MVDQLRHHSAIALSAATVAIVAVLGGTSYAASRPSHHATVAAPGSHSLSKGAVKKIVKAYVATHVVQPIEFASSTDSSSGGGPVKTIGPWTINLSCDSNGVGINVTGPGVVAGANTLGVVNGPAGSSFETLGGGGGTNTAGPGFQASQTLVLLSGSDGYTVTYMANADKSTPLDCAVLGYALPLPQ
jgi:hypothetical protein